MEVGIADNGDVVIGIINNIEEDLVDHHKKIEITWELERNHSISVVQTTA